jgi:hypothetical protein
MLGRRCAQKELFGPDHVYLDHVGSGSFYGLLSQKGHQWFRDEDFAGLYREEFGRPSVPPSQLCILLLLQAHDGVSDEEAIARTAYDLRWKVALGVGLGEKLCAKSTLQLFRAKLVLHESYGQLFEKSVEVCRQAGLLKRRKLEVAIDTTPILGRGAVKDTFNLVSDQIRRVVDEACALKGWDCAAVAKEQGLGRHFGTSFKGSVDLDWTDPEARRALLGQLVADAHVALELAKQALRGFGRDAERTQGLREARDLLAELLQQDIDEEPEDGGGPEIRKGTARDRVLSTTDPEMRHGHKSHAKGFDGYKASVVAETESGVILATDVHAANVADREGVKELVEDAATRSGRAPGSVIGDTAYGDVGTRKELSELGAEVIAKAPPGKRKGYFSLQDFRLDRRRKVVTCPAGKRSIRRDPIRGETPGWRYIFSRSECNGCSLRAQCTRCRVSARVVQITERTEELQKLRRQQRTRAFRNRYRQRIVVEHRIARLAQLGVRQARYFGRAKVKFQVALAATVANLHLVGTSATLVRVIQAWFGSRGCPKSPGWRPLRQIAQPSSERSTVGIIRLPGICLLKMATSRPGL